MNYETSTPEPLCYNYHMIEPTVMPISEMYDRDKFIALIQAKMRGKALRPVASEIGGISASTLSRILRGKDPDFDSYIRLCYWLGIGLQDALKVMPKDGQTRIVVWEPEDQIEYIIKSSYPAEVADKLFGLFMTGVRLLRLK